MRNNIQTKQYLMLQMTGTMYELFIPFSHTVPAFHDLTGGGIAGIRHRCWCWLNWIFTVIVVSTPLVCHIRT